MIPQIRRSLARARDLAASRSPRPAVVLAAGLALAAVALATCWRPGAAAPTDHKYVSLRGRVADASGSPVEDVRIEAGGSVDATALTGPDGRFEMTLDLGTLKNLLLAPARVSVRARSASRRIVVSGGVPSLEFELRVGAQSGQPVLEARSNFGIIADALLDALAPPGERNAVLQVGFVATAGAPIDTLATLPSDRHSAVIAEAWVTEEEKPRGRPQRAAPPAPVATRNPPPPVSAPPVTTPPASRAPATANPKPARTPRGAPTRPAWTHADSVRIARENAQREQVAAAQARRDSIWRAQHMTAQARKAVADSLRAIRDALEDSLRRVRYGMPPRAVAAGPITRDAARVQAELQRKNEKKLAALEKQRLEAARKEREKSERLARKKEKQIADRQRREGIVAPLAGDESEDAPPEEAPPTRPARSSASPGALRSGGRSVAPSSGLHRIEPGPQAFLEGESDEDARARLERDSCTCRVRGTVEMEFHRLLSSPMKIEVSIKELPALRDTIELFMGSPRAFDLRRVPCGRWSLSLHPFSERPFGVTTPEEVAPFTCRQKGLRQVRIVIAPL